MRIHPICQHIANELNTAVLLYSTQHTSPSMSYLPKEDFDLTLLETEEVLDYLFKHSTTSYPTFSFLNQHICFMHFSCEDGIYIIGPFQISFSEGDLDAKHVFYFEQIQLSDLSPLTVAYPPFALKYSLLLYNLYQETDISLKECLDENFYTEILKKNTSKQNIHNLFSNRENKKMHNSYDQELRMLKSIEDGNVEKLKESWKETNTERLGTTSIDPVRNGKNMAIYNITACGRAAIRGGLSAEYVFSLTDTYSQQIEGLKNMLLLQPLVQDAQINYAQMVADLKKHQGGVHEHPTIRRCKDYIFKNLHNKISVSEIADILQVHPNFLSTLFHEEEGITLTQYILQEKIELTKNLLTYSDYSYIDIANYLGFHSQSHLGQRFKSVTGMTLKQYRDLYKNRDFDNE